MRDAVPGGMGGVIDAVPDGPRGVRTAKVSVEPDAAQLRVLVDALAAGVLMTRVAATLPLGHAA